MNTQTITRKNLRIIFDSISGSCNWKERIQNVLWNDEKDISVEDSVILEGYNAANEEQKKIIKKFFKINIPKDIMDEIKDFKDILRLSGIKLADVIPWKTPKNKKQKSQNAFAKIQLIAEVYNEGWVEKFDGVQRNYYPWFEKKAPSGWRLSAVGSYHSSSGMGFGTLYKSEKHVRDAVSKFIDIYIEYLPQVCIS